MKYFLSITLAFLLLISGCSDTSVIYENSSDLKQPYKIKLHEINVVSETEDNLTLDFIYTYEHEIPAEEIKLYVMPDHGYWSTNNVKISRGKHGARVIIGLSSSNMKRDNVTESVTTKLRFRFDHYLPKEYLGNVWGQDIAFNKTWRKRT